MAEHERKTPSGTEDIEEIRRKKQSAEQVPEKLKAQVGEPNPFAAIVESPIGETSLGEHAALLGDERFSHPANAEQTARLVTGLQQSYGNAYVQRVMERIQVEKGSGKPLEAGTRLRMEAAFKQDFSDIRIHTDATADKLAGELYAKAFTSGKDIFFGEGTYQPTSEGGKRLLSHELTHVVQQEGGIQAGNTIGRIGDAFEQEAALVEQAMSEGQEVSVEMTSAVPALQRQPPEETGPAKEEEKEGKKGLDNAGRDIIFAWWRTSVALKLVAAHQDLDQKTPNASKAASKISDANTAAREIYIKLADYGEQDAAGLVGVVLAKLGIAIAALQPHIGEPYPLASIRDFINPTGVNMGSSCYAAQEAMRPRPTVPASGGV